MKQIYSHETLNPFPLPIHPTICPLPHSRWAPGIGPCDRMSTQGRPRQQRRKPRANTDAAGTRKRGLCAPLADRAEKRRAPGAPKDDQNSSSGNHGLAQMQPATDNAGSVRLPWSASQETGPRQTARPDEYPSFCILIHLSFSGYRCSSGCPGSTVLIRHYSCKLIAWVSLYDLPQKPWRLYSRTFKARRGCCPVPTILPPLVRTE